ncbi:MAG: glycoside hydrolase family 16 protein [Pirellulaceae bacterium]
MRRTKITVCRLIVTLILSYPLGHPVISNAIDKNSVESQVKRFSSEGYKLVWSDEFSKDGAPNPKNWSFEKGFVRNNEDQWYQQQNAVCKDGMLVITGREELKRNPNFVSGSTGSAARKNIEYTSSSLMTKGHHRWTMGRFVMRAKIPHGEGMWPAFWAVGENGEWPSCGEIDIMEYYQDKLLANVANGTTKRWNAKWHSNSIKTKDLGGRQWLEQFHVWRMDWDTEAIRLYVDDKLLNETKLVDTYNPNSKWGPRQPFHYPHYLIINLALGGDKGGDVGNAKLPAAYLIDYVRVYQREQDLNFSPEAMRNPSPAYSGKRVGIHHFSELPKTLNRRCSWEKGADSRSYSWKPPGRSQPSAEMIVDYKDKVEGEQSYRFVLNHGWSRWVLEMNPDYGEGIADLSSFRKMGFALKSSDAANWSKFRVIIQSEDGKAYEASMDSLGFKPDGKWHRCQISLGEVARSGVDLTKIRTLLAIGWEDGVRSGQYYKLDNLYVE